MGGRVGLAEGYRCVLCWIFRSSRAGFSGFHFHPPISLSASTPRMLLHFQVHGEPSARGSVIESFQGRWLCFSGSGPPAESLAWTSKISENRRARTSHDMGRGKLNPEKNTEDCDDIIVCMKEIMQSVLNQDYQNDNSDECSN